MALTTARAFCMLIAATVAVAAQAQPAPEAGAGATNAAAAVVPGATFADGVKAFDAGRHEEALRIWLPLARQGRANAQYNVAVLYEQGLGTPKNDVEAARWYLAAAERGDVSAQLKVGSLYEAGIGVSADPAKAAFWYGEAAKGGTRDAAAAQKAKARLAALPQAPQVGPEEIFAFEGGRYVLRRAAGNECVIALQGPVTQPANVLFDDVVKRARQQGCMRPMTLLLESPGGWLKPGLELGRSVHDEGMRTVARYACASACSLIFLAGTERVLWGARAAIGFHQIGASDGENLQDKHCVTTPDEPQVIALRRYLRFVVPERGNDLFALTMATPCKSIEWVKGQRALDLAVATRVEAENRDVFGPRQARIAPAAAASRQP